MDVVRACMHSRVNSGSKSVEWRFTTTDVAAEQEGGMMHVWQERITIRNVVLV